eukprot:m.42819 g.42819  ORF g.42819 m.42819 type:complete len:580 (+) comp11584_c0_seq3:4146-5885(+)
MFSSVASVRGGVAQLCRPWLGSTVRGLASAPPAGKERLIIFDTTLRDGEQSPGVSLTVPEKVLVAKQLSHLGVDVCEAGFPIASEGDFEAVSTVAREVGSLTEGRVDGETMAICGLARAKTSDIDRCFEAVCAAPRHRIHMFLATSDIHLEHKLQITREQCLRQISDMVAYGKSICGDIEFSPEDAGRTDLEFLTEALAVAIEAGATTLNIPDTVGYNLPQHYGDRIKYLIDNTKGSEKAVFSAHCHNDLGLATANTIAGIHAGCRQAEVTINGIGERAGNTALEEVVMALRVHPSEFPVYCNVNSTHITSISHAVARLTRMTVQPNKAIVGANAFRHESGIHQDGVLKEKSTYEIIRPEDVGVSDDNLLTLGKLSGKAAIGVSLSKLGYDMDDEMLSLAVKDFKRLADQKRNLTDGDLHAIASTVMKSAVDGPRWQLLGIGSFSTMQEPGATQSTATITLKAPHDEKPVTAAVASTGSVDALYAAIDSIVHEDVVLTDYRIESISPGKDAMGEVTVTITPAESDHALANKTFSGYGADTDVLIASARAYVNAINNYLHMKNHTQTSQEAKAAAQAASV